MSIEEIVKAWKSEETALEAHIPANPVGQELTEEELQEVIGGLRCTVTCEETSLVCNPTCKLSAI
ncbi:hypothetical protein KSC_041750 [Ktedonobacter sp. SOSP1-52]|uniref:mersacidin/lichenicidin family type 2 lantibiotic n=1 Tax=Ktedonobacter sp. SOSP1-52 TaxID=2778366 RepID=UPI00191589C4|nr:mersacidin/lichenicidin family type 2 lantibiotic [Ktedonobacter sp. SOSP1-52]GHO65283.1 hypothetical protein KSC_041750 [Ktedonobacter sp. SOSP1-52]